MPYYISDQNADCSGWAVVKVDGELVACQQSKQAAIDNAVAISLAEDEPFMGELGKRNDSGDPIVICDIDGTLISGGRLSQRVYNFARSQTGALFIVTGRPESDRANTESELKDLGVTYSRLIMNPGSTSDSVDYKKATAQKLLETYKVTMAIENNPDALRAYSSLGIDAVNPSDIPATRKLLPISVRDAGDWMMLNERQQEMAENLAELTVEQGMFNQGIGGNGAHYAPADKNPFASEGIKCGNCIFFNEARQQCQIVEGVIETEAVCKLWVIPESDLGITEEPIVEPMDVPADPQMAARSKWLRVANEIKARLEGVEVEDRSFKKAEVRTNHIELRAAEGDGMTFEGYASVFNSPSEPLPFTEIVQPGAFKRSLQSRNRMMLLWNHDTSNPLASTRNGSLVMTEDNVGLKVRATLPQTSLGKDIAELVRSGVIDSMSFGFSVKKDSWSADGQTRYLEDVTLYEVSLVSTPAYEGTAGSVSVRSLEGISADVLAEALLKIESGEELEADQGALVAEVIGKLTKTPEVVEVEGDILALKKKKLDLLMMGN